MTQDSKEVSGTFKTKQKTTLTDVKFAQECIGGTYRG